MTTLIAWISYSDSGSSPHLPRAVYVASDSRITWGSAERRWEAGRKVFAPTTEPHLFGYCGDVVLPSLILGQLISAIDAGVLFAPQRTMDERHQAITIAVEHAVASAASTPTRDFTILHLGRETPWPDTAFRGWTIHYTASSGTCTSNELAIPKKTDVIKSFGSGRASSANHQDRWRSSDVGGRSRAIYSAFHDSIGSSGDPLSGGPPQLTALYTEGAPRQIGICFNERRYLNGLDVSESTALLSVEWRDSLGQQVDPNTGLRAPGTRRFVRPVGITAADDELE